MSPRRMIFWTRISLGSNDSIPGGRRPGGKCGVWQPPTTSTDGTTAALVITPVWLIASYWSAYDTLARRDYDRCPADLLTCCPLLLYHFLYISLTATRVLIIVSRIKSHFLRTTTTHVSRAYSLFVLIILISHHKVNYLHWHSASRIHLRTWRRIATFPAS